MAKKIDKTNILLENIVNAIQDVKGKDIISLDLKKIDSAICKYFVICTGKQYTIKQFINLVAKRLKINIIWRGKGINEKGIVATIEGDKTPAIKVGDVVHKRLNESDELKKQYPNAPVCQAKKHETSLSM